VETFINSGNVIFNSPTKSAAAIAKTLDAKLEPLLGFKSEAFVRTAGELHAIATLADAYNSRVPIGGEVNVAFLTATMTPAQIAILKTLRTDFDDFEYSATEVFWLCNGKQSESKFSNAVLERKLGVKSTFRRLRMLEKLSAKLCG
jgi:uncharacterized protein (DUF1697 family)